MSIKRKNVMFLIYYAVIIIFMTFPGVFDLANRVEPWVLGLPFVIFYLLVCVGLLFVGLLGQFLLENKLGELDLTVEELDES